MSYDGWPALPDGVRPEDYRLVSSTEIRLPAIPEGLRVTIEQPLSLTTVPVADVLAISTTISGMYDGDAEYGEPQSRHIRFTLGMRTIGGLSLADTGEIAALIAAHLAAHDGDWPTAEAHVRLWPVTDFTLRYLVTPERIAGREPPPMSERVQALCTDLGIDPSLPGV